MTLFKKNFSYKRGWQFANKLKLFTLFFVMLTSLIAGATSVSAQGVNSDGWDYYPNMGIVAKLDYEGEVACASTYGKGCLHVNAKSEIKFKDLKPLKCGSMHAGIYGFPGYKDRGHWCEKLDRIKKTALLNIRPQEWVLYPNFGWIVANLNFQGEVACASYNGKRCLDVNAKSEINFKDLKPLKCGPEHVTIYGNTGYNSRNLNHWCRKLKAMRDKGQGTPDKPDVSGGKPKPPVDLAKPDKPASGTGAELTSKPDQFKWFSGQTIGFDGLVTPDYQGQAACASTDGVSCLMNVAMKDVNFATLRPVKCMVADYNNPQHWCAKVKKHVVFLSLQSREYYSRPTIDGSKYVKGYQPVVQGEPGSVLALSGAFMDLSSDSLSYEYADLEFKKVIASNNAEITSKLAIPASCNPSWVNYASSSVSEVVNNIEATSDICAQEFFKVARLQLQSPVVANITNLFKPAVVQEAVDRLQAYLTPWDGVTKNKEIYNLTVFLRAYKYVTFYNPSVSANVALETKITALFSRGLTYGNGFFGMDAKLEKIRTNSLQSRILYELIMAQGNYNSWNADGIEYITKVIRDFSPATFNTLSVKERTAVARILSSIFATLYYDNTIVGKINNDPLFLTAYKALVAELVKFAFDKKVASYPNLALNAAREAVRYPLASSQSSTAFNGSLDRYYANISKLKRNGLDVILSNAVDPNRIYSWIINSIFPMTYNCGDASVEFHYDTASTTQGEIMQLCTDFITTSTEFASKMGITLSAPLESNDMKGHTLKMYVYNNENDWRLYGNGIFNLGTSSPGAFVDNYKKSKAPEAHIFRTESDLTFGKAPFWNAVHEYTHYLVSKYITKGGSAELTMAQLKGLLWYEEGLAEYFHSELYHGRDNQVISAHNLDYLPWFKKTKADGLSLIDIIAGHSDHAYSSGYTAVKYLLEKQPKVFSGLTANLQAGDRHAFISVAGGLGSLYNNDFNLWLANKAK